MKRTSGRVWTAVDGSRLWDMVSVYCKGNHVPPFVWPLVARKFPGRTAKSCQAKYWKIRVGYHRDSGLAVTDGFVEDLGDQRDRHWKKEVIADVVERRRAGESFHKISREVGHSAKGCERVFDRYMEQDFKVRYPTLFAGLKRRTKVVKYQRSHSAKRKGRTAAARS